MKWRGRGSGGRIEDRRGAGGSFGGGGIPIPMGKAGGGGLGLIIALVVFLLFGGGLPGGGGGLGVDPGTGPFGQAPTPSEAELEKAPADDPGKFVDYVAGDVDATWKRLFADSGKTYEQPIVSINASHRSVLGPALEITSTPEGEKRSTIRPDVT